MLIMADISYGNDMLCLSMKLDRCQCDQNNWSIDSYSGKNVIIRCNNCERLRKIYLSTDSYYR